MCYARIKMPQYDGPQKSGYKAHFACHVPSTHANVLHPGQARLFRVIC